jgi:hypothetical protein
MRHESRIDIERFTIVVGQQLEIPDEMYDQKKDQEDAGKAHDQLLTERGGK